jgi:hypothetical protein
MIISIDAEKSLRKFNIPSLSKALKSLGIKGMCLNIIKAINNKSAANIVLNEENIENISSEIRNETRMSTRSAFFFFFDTVIEFLARALRQDTGMQGL